VPTRRIIEIITSSPSETEQTGSRVGKMLTRGDVIALSGELGSGKTTLVRGLAQGMGFDREQIASPSFTLVNEYEGPLPFFHIDLYRLRDERELQEIGYEEYISEAGVAVIEWADRAPSAVPAEALWIRLRYHDAERREIIMQAQGRRYEKMIEELKKKVYNK
jgi:tRNA threonylcarbamoyladenosine biosynthesis protein TsaE